MRERSGWNWSFYPREIKLLTIRRQTRDEFIKKISIPENLVETVETFSRDLSFIFRRFKSIRRIQTFLFPFLKNSFSLGNENWKVSRNWISWLFTKGLKNSLKCRGRQSCLSRVSFHWGHESFWSNLMVLVIFWHIYQTFILAWAYMTLHLHSYGYCDKLMISLKLILVLLLSTLIKILDYKFLKRFSVANFLNVKCTRIKILL